MQTSVRFTIDSQPLEVDGFELHEGLDQPFLAQILASSRAAVLDLDAAIGARGVLVITHGAGTRTVEGIVRRVERLEDDLVTGPSSATSWMVELVPKLWALSLTKGYRAFQDASEVDVALALLSTHGIEPELRLDRARYKKREIRIQYGESDLAFFARMLEECGVAYWFETRFSDGGSLTALVLGDAPQASTPKALAFDGGRLAKDFVGVFRVGVERRLRPGRYTLRDRDFRKPWSEALEATFVPGAGVTPLEASLERFHYVPGGFLFASELADTPAADDRIATRTDIGVALERAERRLLAKRVDARSVSLATTDFSIAPARTITVVGAPALSPGEPLLVLTTVLRGRWDQLEPLECTATSGAIPYHPVLATERPSLTGFETATVVGPVGEEIHTDEFGRVRVHFHWDQDDGHDERSSSWLHVSQPWAGTGYGSVNLPRGGQEVVVEFIAGDPDRPIIVGRVHTDLQKVPYKLPLNKTQSGWKTSSTNRTGGFNELMFEDKGGDEHLRMRAQRDLETAVLRDESRTVENDRRTRIARNDARVVGGHQSHNIEGSNQKTVRGNVDNLVKGDATQFVTGPNRSTVGQNVSSFTGGSRFTTNGSFRETDAGTSRCVSAAKHHYAAGGCDLEFDDGQLTWQTGASWLAITRNELLLESEEISISAKRYTASSQSVVSASCSNVSFKGGVVEIKGSLVTLNQPKLPVGRLTEEAPAIVANGAGTVQIGGPSLPADAQLDADGNIKMGTLTIEGDGEFVAETLANLAEMNKTKRGQTLLKTLTDPNATGDIRVTPNPYGGSSTDPNWFGLSRNSTIKYDPTEEQGDLPGDAILYDHLRQADRLRTGGSKDESWLQEEQEYLRERRWPKYRTSESGEYTDF